MSRFSVSASTFATPSVNTYTPAIAAGRNHTFVVKEDVAIFIKYKAAQAGEIDWRPTEPLPEDDYAL